MALKITYWAASRNSNIAKAIISSETIALSSSSAQSGATPANADYVSVTATEVAAINYSGTNPTALADASGTSAYMASGERLWLDAVSGFKIAGIQAT